MEEGNSDLNILTAKSAGMKHLGRLRRRWEGNIRVDIKEIGFNDRIRLIRLRKGIIGEPLW
jgi:hypothetical protein